MFLTICRKLVVNSIVNSYTDLNMLLEIERVTNVPRNTFITRVSYTDDWIPKLNTLIKVIALQ